MFYLLGLSGSHVLKKPTRYGKLPLPLLMCYVFGASHTKKFRLPKHWTGWSLVPVCYRFFTSLRNSFPPALSIGLRILCYQ